MKRAILLLLVCLAAPAAFAWGEKGHYIVNEAATHGLPTDMPPFFLKAFGELTWLGFEPDRWRNAGESLDANAPNHFLDYEFVEGLELPEDRYQFIALLYSSDRLRQRGITNWESGFLPWAIAEESQKLLVAFRLWRASAPGSMERAWIERDVIHIAGVLGHYAGDSANPHHATINYNGWIEPNPNRYPIDCGTHSRFETQFVSHAVDVKDVIPLVAAPQVHTDFFKTAVAQLQESNALTETLYRLDRDGAFSQFGAVKKEGFAFATSRLADAAALLRDLWYSAWVNSAKRAGRE
ncbi:MAG TPA: hypothetical protein VGF48_11135 [Thermoanaerobaculia bacterium]|jgi:hypothetical protein